MPLNEMALNSQIETKLSSEKRETTPEQLLQTQQNIFSSNQFYQKHTQLENHKKQIFLAKYTENLNKIWDNWFEESKKETYSKPEVQVKPKELNEKEKIGEYAMLANLAYARFEKIDKIWETNLPNLQIKEANLDVAWIDFTKFDIDNKWKFIITDTNKLSSDEKFIVSYFNNQNNFKDWENKSITADKDDKNISDIIDVALFRNKQELTILAWERLKSQMFADAWNIIKQNMVTDIWNDYRQDNTPTQEEQKIKKYTEFIDKNRLKLEKTLIKLKESKTSEYQKQFNDLKEKWDLNSFKILAYYPEENSKNTWWLQCVLFEKNWKKILSIAWTQLTDIWDIKSGFSILFGKIPETQTKRMIDFFKNNLNSNEQITIVWHSLGWTLSQIWTSIYWNNWNIETYTFNSPGAKNMDVSINPNDSYQKELQNFTNSRNSDIIGKSIINVKWKKWFSFIADRWVDIWDYRIDIETSSHSISAIIEAIGKVERLVKVRTDNTEWKRNK